MAIVSCPECGKKLKVADTSVGKKVKGPCGHVFVAHAGAEPAPAPAAPVAPEKVYVACTECGAKLKVGTPSLGKRMKCPKCSAVFVASLPEEEPAPAPKAKAKPAVSDDDMDDLLSFAQADAANGKSKTEDEDLFKDEPIKSRAQHKMDEEAQADDEPRPKGKGKPRNDEDEEPMPKGKKPGKPPKPDEDEEPATPVYPSRLIPTILATLMLLAFGGLVGAIFFGVNIAKELGLPDSKGVRRAPPLKLDGGAEQKAKGKEKDKIDEKEAANIKEAAKFNGVWTVVSAEMSGMSLDAMKGLKFTFADGTVTTPDPVVAPFTVDASQDPKWISLPTAAKIQVSGIYELDGDTLKWCTGIPQKKRIPGGKEVAAPGPRPKKFDAAEGVLVVLTREKKADANPDPPENTKDATRLDGAWITESFAFNGKTDTSKKGEPLVFANGKVNGLGPTPAPYTVEPGAEVNAIDIMVTEKVTLPGIFKFDNGMLQLCLPADGKQRPKSFDEKGVVLGTLRRAAKGELLYSPTASRNKIKLIGLVLHDYHDKHKAFPPAGISDASGKPLLSWRVAILPFLGEEAKALYMEFDLDQPWDSPQNKALIAKMPQVYVMPFVEAPEGMTHYRTLVGPGTVLEPLKGKDGKLTARTLLGLTDGAALTITVVEAKEPTIWTRPDDLPYDPVGPLPKFGVSPIGFNVALADGLVVFVRSSVPEKVLRPYLTGNNGMRREPLDPDAFKGNDDFKDYKDKEFKDKDKDFKDKDKDFKDKEFKDKDFKDKDFKDKESKGKDRDFGKEKDFSKDKDFGNDKDAKSKDKNQLEAKLEAEAVFHRVHDMVCNDLLYCRGFLAEFTRIPRLRVGLV